MSVMTSGVFVCKNTEQGEAVKKTEGKTGKKRILKVCLIFLGIFFFLLSGSIAGFFYLRVKGEKGLKTAVPAAEQSEKKSEKKGQKEQEDLPEGIYTTYQGKRYRYKEDVINFLCLGIDKDIPMEEKRNTGSEGLADAVLLVSINVQSKDVKLLAIPRETVIPVKVFDRAGNFLKTENKQITLQYAYGRTAKDSCELTAEAVSNLLYKLPIQRYCAINFTALPVLNDAIGGVKLTALETVQWWNGSFYEGQDLHLKGQMALDYVRQRDETIPESSMGRLERQKQYITGFIDQAKAAVKKDVTLPAELFQQLTDHMCTNITLEDLAYLAPELVNIRLNPENIGMVPGDVVPAGEHEEYHVHTEELKKLVIQSFYEEVPEEGITGEAVQ